MKGGIGRRMFLKMIGAVTVLFSSAESAWSYFVSSLGVRTVERDNFRFDHKTGLVLYKDKGIQEPYKLLIDGMVERPVSFSYSDIKEMNLLEQTSDFHCVEGWSVKDIKWRGIRFSELYKRVKPLKGAGFVTFHSLGETTSKPRGQGHYIESMPIDALLDERRQILLAIDKDGIPLSHEHGAPMRLISPFDLGYKSIKYVYKIEFDSKHRSGWWTIANPIYNTNAPVPENRLRKR